MWSGTHAFFLSPHFFFSRWFNCTRWKLGLSQAFFLHSISSTPPGANAPAPISFQTDRCEICPLQAGHKDVLTSTVFPFLLAILTYEVTSKASPSLLICPHNMLVIEKTPFCSTDTNLLGLDQSPYLSSEVSTSPSPLRKFSF